MATSRFRPYKKDDKDEDENVKGPMEYVYETEECICGWCGQLLIPNHANETPEAHFRLCKNSKDNRLLRVFKELRLVQQSFQVLNAEISEMKKQMDTVKTEVMADHVNMKAEFNNEILALKAEIKLKKGGENNDGALVAFNNKVKVLEDGMKEKMREMGVDQERKMAEVNGRFTGVTETISTVVHSILEGVRGKEIKSTDTKELDQLKRKTESLSEQVKSNIIDLKLIKRQLENEGASDEATKKKKRFQVEPSPSEQLIIPMNCFNLVTQNYLFQPSYRWTIDGIKAKLTQGTFELTSEMFQWRGYPVQARAKLQLKEDDYVHLSLCLKDASNDESKLKDLTIIPQVFYLLKHTYAKNAKHKCKKAYYLLGSPFSSSLVFELNLIHKSWLNHSAYNVYNSVEVEIYVEPVAVTHHVHSYDGTLEWNMENYARRLQLERDCFVPHQESRYFYTSPDGYRVKVEIFLKGNDGKKMTARVSFLTGKFDAQLPNSFPHLTTVTLINRKEPERTFTKTIEEDIKVKKWYDFELCKLAAVNNFIENDALLLKVSIESQKKPVQAKLK